MAEAYNPESSCFGCGPSSPDGLHLRSRRMPGEGLGRLEARLAIPARYCAFPGIVNGGILSTIMDCHGNWAAAVCLMDKGCLPRPPLTLTASMSVIFKEPTPPNTELILRSRVLSLRESAAASGASTGGGGGAYGSSSGGSGSGAYGSSSGNKMAQAQMQKATVEVEVVVLQPLDPATVAADAPPSSAVVQGAETAAGAAGGSQGFTRGAGTPEPAMKILAVGRGVFKRLGALRAL
ncbi:hypothetical protein HXX76_010477 [Chlamydomonas incerta]|uniref:Thioesterase domain-containing protein n=1 Tax=Chlamydomonas incerta TaxID=51695 RepID=A0A835SXI1_CHLIN|nr:hypothetical protein HXX76_010477 [Chlamydomonas incerta]|eukprot:KAG2428330.1 hypothetical protein HXX76_010477 [Chlamydomonas incerta]